MYNILFAYTKKKRLLLTTLCGLFFFAEDQKRNFSFKRKEKKTKKKENFWIPVFDWGLALNPIAFIHSHAKFIIY